MQEMDIKAGKGCKVRGLLTTADTEWYDFRSKVQQPMMRPHSMYQYTPALEDIVDDFMETKIRGRRDPSTGEVPDDFLHDLYKWALESVTFLALDTRLGCLASSLPDDSDPMRLIRAVSDLFRLGEQLEQGSSFWTLAPTASSK